jgi:acyl-CoA synthetase (AMP-forming)/AMP-acid ligase II
LKINASSGLRFAPNFNVAVSFIDRHIADGRGAKVAIRTADDAVTYDELTANINRCANALIGLGFSRGDRLLLVVKDCPAFFYLFWGAIKAGIVPIPLNTLLRSSSYAFMIEDSGAAAFVYSPEFANEVEPALAEAARASRIVLRTEGGANSLTALLARSAPTPCRQRPKMTAFGYIPSGSTGLPKAAVHRHRDMVVTS